MSSAASRSGRVALYSAGTVGPDDLAVVPGAAAAAATTFDTGLKAPWSVTAMAPGGADRTRLIVDGRPWPAGPGTAVVPAGEHRLEWSTGAPVGPALLRLTAELGTATVTPTTLGFTYDSRPPTLAVVDRRPTGLVLDGVESTLDTVVGAGGASVVRLPGGTHPVTLRFDGTPPVTTGGQALGHSPHQAQPVATSTDTGCMRRPLLCSHCCPWWRA